MSVLDVYPIFDDFRNIDPTTYDWKLEMEKAIIVSRKHSATMFNYEMNKVAGIIRYCALLEENNQDMKLQQIYFKKEKNVLEEKIQSLRDNIASDDIHHTKMQEKIHDLRNEVRCLKAQLEEQNQAEKQNQVEEKAPVKEKKGKQKRNVDTCIVQPHIINSEEKSKENPDRCVIEIHKVDSDE